MKALIAATTLVALVIVGYTLTNSSSEPEPEPESGKGMEGADNTKQDVGTAPSLDWLNDVDMESAPMTLQGESIFKVICQVGHPVLVSRRDSDDARLVHFKGPFVQKGDSDDKHRFAYLVLEDLESGSWTTTVYYDRIEGYLSNALQGELLRTLKIPMIEDVPATESALIDMLGPWDSEHSRAGDHKRVVYTQRACVQGQLRPGTYFDIENGRVTRAKAATDRERLTRVVHDLRTFSDEDPTYAVQDSFVAYGEQPIARDGALDILLEFVVAKELGRWNQAYEHLGIERGTDETLRKMAQPSEDGMEIDVASLKYRTVGYQDATLEVLVDYNLENGSHIQHRYGLRPFNGRWRINY